MSLYLQEELVASRLAPGSGPSDPPSSLTDPSRMIDLDEMLRASGGRLAPGAISLSASFVASLWQWRIAGIMPLVGRCSAPKESDGDAVRAAALEMDALSGGTLDAIRIEVRPEAAPIDQNTPPSLTCVDIPTSSRSRIDAPTKERMRGALFGLACGDSLGAPVENWPADKIARIHGPFRDFVSGRGWGPGYPTRETTFALLWFREFAYGRTVHLAEDRNRLAQALGRWVVGRPRDFGHLTRGILQGYLDDPPVIAALKAFDRAHRQTEFNGALSRAAAVGAALPFDLELRRTSAIAASVMTYPAAVCIASAVAVAEGVAAVIRGDSDPLDAARACVWEERTSAALDGIATGGWAPGTGDWAGHERGHPLKTLQSAFWAIRQTGTPEDVLIDLVHRGGDADTHASIAGALLGGRDGADALPARWRDRLRTNELVEDLIRRIAAGA
jgi:ADP-ribosyl-[dinitrogen reductase] hydrolase